METLSKQVPNRQISSPYREDHEGGYLSITYDNSSTYGTYRLGGTANGGLMEVWYTITY